VPEPNDLERDLRALDAALRKLEAEYNMYFAGRLPRPPVEARARVAQLVTKLDRAYIQNYADRFRFNTLQARYSSFAELWDRGLMAREEGRIGPFAPKRRDEPAPKAPEAPPVPAEKVVHVASFSDPSRQMDRLQALYEQLVEARRAVGEQAVPFHRFADLVKTQVQKLQSKGSAEVAFRVSVKDGKVNLTAKGVKGSGGNS